MFGQYLESYQKYAVIYLWSHYLVFNRYSSTNVSIAWVVEGLMKENLTQRVLERRSHAPPVGCRDPCQGVQDYFVL